MTDPVLTVDTVPITDSVRSHPLATLTGINMMVDLLTAGKVWSTCTKPQRALLAKLCPPLVAAVMVRRRLFPEDMPVLPERVSRSSVAALQRRGLADDRGRLTGLAVHTWYHAGRLEKRSADGGAS